jgi:hypothetical protein
MTDTSNKLGLPRDIGHKIMAMLKPKSRPECVLCFHDNYMFFKEGSLTEEDRTEFTACDEIYVHFSKKNCTCFCEKFDPLVRIALFQGFRFKDEASRTSWQNKEDFELYRDAIYSIDTTSS